MTGYEPILLSAFLAMLPPAVESASPVTQPEFEITVPRPTQQLAQHGYYSYPRYRPYYWYTHPSRLYRPGMYQYPITPGYSQGMPPPVYRQLHTTPYGYYRQFPYYHPSYSRLR